MLRFFTPLRSAQNDMGAGRSAQNDMGVGRSVRDDMGVGRFVRDDLGMVVRICGSRCFAPPLSFGHFAR